MLPKDFGLQSSPSAWNVRRFVRVNGEATFKPIPLVDGVHGDFMSVETVVNLARISLASMKKEVREELSRKISAGQRIIHQLADPGGDVIEGDISWTGLSRVPGVSSIIQDYKNALQELVNHAGPFFGGENNWFLTPVDAGIVSEPVMERTPRFPHGSETFEDSQAAMNAGNYRVRFPYRSVSCMDMRQVMDPDNYGCGRLLSEDVSPVDRQAVMSTETNTLAQTFYEKVMALRSAGQCATGPETAPESHTKKQRNRLRDSLWLIQMRRNMEAVALHTTDALVSFVVFFFFVSFFFLLQPLISRTGSFFGRAVLWSALEMAEPRDALVFRGRRI